MPNPPSLIPRILVTNDDGINAAGIAVLERIAGGLAEEVWVVAPEQEQSGASHSLTLHVPVRVRQAGERRFAVSGTPTDCVLLALQEIIPGEAGHKASLLLSGINLGSNVADDITYSGTVAAAMEGTILGVPSIALSQLGERGDAINWDTAERYAPALIQKLAAIGWPAHTLININFPECPPDKVRGARLCPQGKRLVSVSLSSRVDPKGRPYFWLGGERDNTADRPGVDIDLLHSGYITVTPIRMDMTDYQTMGDLQKSDIAF